MNLPTRSTLILSLSQYILHVMIFLQKTGEVYHKYICVNAIQIKRS